MELIDVQPKDVFFLFQMSYSDAKKLELALDNSTVSLNLQNESHREASEYLRTDFYDTVKKAIKTVEGDK